MITYDKNGKDHHAELLLTKPAFLIEGNDIKKIEGKKMLKSDMNEMNNVLANYKGGRITMDNQAIDILRAELGDFDINL